jgi:hypothetical protein
MFGRPTLAQDASVTTFAAVIALLEQREIRAREAYDEIGRRLRGRTINDIRAMTDGQFAAEQAEQACAAARWIEADAALAGIRTIARAVTP